MVAAVTLPLLLTLVVVAIAAPYLLLQVRKPTRFVGRFFAWTMNKSHSRMTQWGLQHLSIGPDAIVLDVGCGGGATIAKLARSARKVYGIDYAAGSVAMARSHNAGLIGEGRVEIIQASVSSLPFPDSQFDFVTAIETQYYWPDLENDMGEILRVLKPGAKLAIMAESYKGGRTDKLQRPTMKLLGSTHLTPDDQRQLFVRAGYHDVEVVEEKRHGWICVMGRKPS